jgi:hypothetical protein
MVGRWVAELRGWLMRASLARCSRLASHRRCWRGRRSGQRNATRGAGRDSDRSVAEAFAEAGPDVERAVSAVGANSTAGVAARREVTATAECCGRSVVSFMAMVLARRRAIPALGSIRVAGGATRREVPSRQRSLVACAAFWHAGPDVARAISAPGSIRAAGGATRRGLPAAAAVVGRSAASGGRGGVASLHSRSECGSPCSWPVAR